MKKLGLLVGLGPETTIPYYRGIVYGTQKRLNRAIVPPMTLENLSTYILMDYARRGDLDCMTEYLVSGIRTLAASGCEVGAIACNTGHLVFDRVLRESPIPLVSIVGSTVDAVKAKGYKKVALFATGATLKSDLLTKPLSEAGVEVVLPLSKEADYISETIDRDLQRGIVTEMTKSQMNAILERMIRDHGVEALILGCTELPLVFNLIKTSVPTINTADEHIRALIDAIL